MPQLIGLCGKRGSGKDTVFSYINEWAIEHDRFATRRAFADKLKLSFVRMFIPSATLDEAVAWCNRIKEQGYLSLEEAAFHDEDTTTTKLTYEVSGRVILQRYGTEGHREIFGENFWTDALLPTGYDTPVVPKWWGNFLDPFTNEVPDFAVVTDVRFDNEAKRIRDLGGEVWEVSRKSLEDQLDFHASEGGVPKEYVKRTIINDGSLEDLREDVRMTIEAVSRLEERGEVA